MRWLVLTVTGLILLAAGVWVVWVSMLEPAEKDIATGYGQFVIALVVPLSGLAVWAARRFTTRTAVPLDQLADRLARRMLDQWTEAAADRRLLEPEPLPIRWRRAELPVAVPVAAATSTRNGRPRFDPLPGLSSITSAMLQEGDHSALHEIYGGLPSGRLVITGRAGSGKSAAAILLLLDALKFRKEKGDPGIPVPVMFTLHGWDPETTPVKQWLIDKLAEIPSLKKGDAARLVDTRQVAVFLDGLDEMPERLRPIALRALSRRADFRLVLLTRRTALVDAARHSPLHGAAVIELQPVEHTDAADYLLRQVVSPPPAGWQAVAKELRDRRRGQLARALDKPLTLTLVRDTYGRTGKVGELLDRKRFPTPNRIEDHLLDQLVAAAYTPEPGDPKPLYSVDVAERTLTVIAHRLKQDGHRRDLAWWTIPRWTDQATAVFIRAMAVWFLTAIPTGFLLGLSYWLANGTGIASGFPVGLVIGFVAVFPTTFMKVAPRRVADGWWWAPFTATGLLMALPLGLGTGFVLVAIGNSPPGLVMWLVLGLVAWLMFGIGSSFFASSQDNNSSSDPRASWRQDAMTGLAIAVTVGLGAAVAGLAFGMGFDPGLPAVLAIGILGGLSAMLSIGVMSTAALPTFLCQVQLALRHRTPMRLMRFLEDARKRGLLRTVGPVYQFRHAKLQDRLAASAGKS